MLHVRYPPDFLRKDMKREFTNFYITTALLKNTNKFNLRSFTMGETMLELLEELFSYSFTTRFFSWFLTRATQRQAEQILNFTTYCSHF